MTKVFKYSILKYVHSQFTNEELNLGIIFHFENGEWIFKYPKKLNRLKKIYSNFRESIIKEYLEAFERTANELNKESINQSFEDVLIQYFLIKEDAPLQFSKESSVTQYSEDTESISRQYFDLYFSEYQNISEIKSNVSDLNIVSKYKKLLLEKDKDVKKYIKSNVLIGNEKSFLKADLVWNNHVTHAVKGVSFDLKENNSIIDKALLIKAKLNYLAMEVQRNDYFFDLLISAPRNLELCSAYDNALKILNDIEVQKQIITEEELGEYSDRTIQELERLFK